jgi:FAD:protein FMN transferase
VLLVSRSLLLLSLVTMFSLVTTASAGEVVHTGSTMGTRLRIVVSTESPEIATDVADAIAELLESVENQMSTWRPESELSLFNRSQSLDWFEVSAETASVVVEALRIAKLSDGAFDPTVGPLVRLWSFNEGSGERRIPTDDEITNTRSRIGYQKIEVRLDPPAMKKSQPDVELDLSAIAKGYAVDAVSELLTAHKLPSHLVEIGGEIRGEGLKSDGTAWRAGIQTPDALPGTIYEALPLTSKSLATSGDYWNYFEIDGKRYSHTIDPATGRPIEHGVASVSVIVNTCMEADALATAINVLGPEKGLALAEQSGAAAFILIRTEDSFRTESNASFAALARQSQPEADVPANPLFATLIAALIVVGIAITGMAVGVIFSNRCIKGSCGGLASMPGGDGSSPCDLCTKPAEQCERKMSEQSQTPPTFDA